MERTRSARVFALLCALIAFGVLQLVASPNSEIELFLTGHVRPVSVGRSEGFAVLAENPFAVTVFGGNQFRLRILGPLVAWPLQIRGPWASLVAWPMTLVALYLVARLAQGHFVEHVRRAELTLLLPVVLATAHPFVVANASFGFQDGMAAIGPLVAMRYRAWWVAAPAFFLGMLADERVLGAAGFVLMWHWLHDPVERRVTLARLRFIASAVALGLWAMYAMAMLRHVGLTPVEFFAPAWVRTDWMFRRVPLHYWLGLRAGWLVPAAVLAAAFSPMTRQRLGLCAVGVLFTVPLLAASLKVGDVSRVVGFTFPLILVAAIVLHRWRPEQLIPVLACAAAMNVIMPVATGIGSNTYPLPSAPFSLLAWLLGLRDGL